METEHLTKKGVLNYAIYDCETTDVDRNFAQITQFAGIIHAVGGEEKSRIDIRCKMPAHVVPSPHALLVTKVSPDQLSDGLPPQEFAWRVANFFEDARTTDDGQKRLERVGADGSVQRIPAKAMAMGHNSLNADDPWIRQLLYQNMFANPYVTNTQGVMRTDSLNTARAAAIFSPETFATGTYPETGKKSFKLGDLAKANDVVVRDGKVFNADDAHDALYDIEGTRGTYFKMADVASAVVTQMEQNADPSALIAFLRGTRSGFDDQRPVISYGRAIRGNTEAQMGVLVDNDSQYGNRRRAVIYNLANDPRELLDKTEDEILEIMRKQDPWSEENREKDYQGPESAPMFERIALNKTPMVMPAELGMRVGASRGLTMQELEERKKVIENNPDLRDRIMKAAVRAAGEWPEPADPQPEDDIFYGMGQDKTREELAGERKTRSLLKEFQPKRWEFDRSDVDGWRDFLAKQGWSPERIDGQGSQQKAINVLWERRAEIVQEFSERNRNGEPACGRYAFFGTQALYYNRPDLLNDQQTKIMEAHVASRVNGPEDARYMTVPRALKALEEIKKNPEEYEKFVGDDPDKKRILDQLEGYYRGLAKEWPLTQERRQIMGLDQVTKAEEAPAVEPDEKPTVGRRAKVKQPAAVG